MRSSLALSALFLVLASGAAHAKSKSCDVYQALVFVSSGDGQCSAFGCDVQLTPVPKNKRLLVQQISGSIQLLAGFSFAGTFRTGDFNADSVRIQILPEIQSISSGTRQLARFSQAVTGYVFEGQVPYFQVGAIGAGVDTNASAEFALTGCLESAK
jgi:hypothetical protein